MSRSIRSRVIGELKNLALADDCLTSSQLEARLLNVKLSSLSSILNRMARKGEVVRVPDVGPRGGYGYRLKNTRDIDMVGIVRSFMERDVG